MSRSFGYWDTYELADKIEGDVGYSIAHKIQRGDCLDSYELRQVENALDSQGMSKNWDYREEICHCRTDDEYSEY